MTVVGIISQVNCIATACSLTRDSVARDSGGHHIEHLHRVNASHLLLARQGYGSPRHAPGPVNFNLLVSNKLHIKPCFPLLDAPVNGKITTIEADGITKHICFSCNPNYVLIGESLATCNDGVWSSSTPCNMY